MSAPTQTTAPVHEFRCLYTRDLHKKAKKWHDGSVRFHTFNRRVMVYDDSKNYIGDLHYRQQEEFAEGVELQLDRGVKVEVGERLGETQTDLAPILERHRLEKATSDLRSAPRRPRAGLVPSTTSLQRPKSLADVLGPSRGCLGRARLHLQSPYEQRQAWANAAPQEPPLKKRKPVGDNKENQKPPLLVPPPPPVGAALHQRQDANPARKPEPGLSLRRGLPIELDFWDVLEISSDDEPGVSVLMPTGAVAAEQTETREKPPRRKALSGRTGPREKEQKGSRTKTMAEDSSRSGPAPAARGERISRTRAASLARPLQSRPPAPVGESSASRPARMLLARPSARPKLMYKALRQTASHDRLKSQGRRQRHVSSPSNECSPRKPPHDVRPQVVQGVSDEKHSEPVQAGTSSNIHQSLSPAFNGSASSPLFVAQSDVAASSPRSTFSMQEDLMVPTADQTGESQDDIGAWVASNSERPVQTDLLPPVRNPRAKLSPLDQTLPQCPSAGVTESKLVSPQRHSVGGVLPGEDDASATGQTLIAAGRHGQVLEPKSVGEVGARPAVARVRPTRLQRSASSTTAFVENKDSAGNERASGSVEIETGPWTTAEAVLLFDWWPPGRKRPDLGIVLDGEAAPAREAVLQITTARELLEWTGGAAGNSGGGRDFRPSWT